MDYSIAKAQIKILDDALSSGKLPGDCINACRLAKNVLQEQVNSHTSVDYFAQVPTLDNY